jgi:hypothetical protein
MLEKPPQTRKPVSVLKHFKHSLGMYWSIINNKNIRHDIDVLCETISREITNSKGVVKHKRTSVGTEEKLFINLFKEKYLLYADLEYKTSIDSTDMVMIGDLIRKLREKSISVAQFLNWVFDVFYADKFNKKFIPSLKYMCNHNLFANFMIQNMTRVKEQKKQEQIVNRERSVREQAKIIYRKTKNENVKMLIEKYNEGIFSLNDFEDELKKIEPEHDVSTDEEG